MLPHLWKRSWLLSKYLTLWQLELSTSRGLAPTVRTVAPPADLDLMVLQRKVHHQSRYSNSN